MSETQDAQIRNTIPANIAKPLSSRFVRIFRNSNDGLYYGKTINDTIELIGGPSTIGTVFAQGGDTTLGFLIDKLIEGTNITITPVDLGGGNISLEISATGGSADVESGTYAGVATPVINVVSSVTNNIQWLYSRIGKQVSVKAYISLEVGNPNSAIQFNLSLPPGLPIDTTDPNVVPLGVFIGDRSAANPWNLEGLVTGQFLGNFAIASSQEGTETGGIQGGNVVVDFTYQTP